MTSSTTIAGAPERPRVPDAPRVLSRRTVHEGRGRFLVARLRLAGVTDDGALPDMKTLPPVFALRHRRPDLFTR